MNATPPATDASEATPAADDAAVRGTVYAEALPIWAKQIESARQQTEEAVVALIARFEGIVKRLDRALGAVSAESDAQTITADAQALVEIGTNNGRAASRDPHADTDSQEHIRTVLERFKARTTQLIEAAQESQRASESIKREVCESLVQLQFQDRVSQILQHIVASIRQAQELPVTAAAGGSARDQVQEHLDNMVRTYTTEEQRRLHEGLESQVIEPQSVTFF